MSTTQKTDFAALLRTAQQQFNSGQFQQAEPLFRQVASAQPRNVDALVGLAQAHARLGNRRQSALVFTELGKVLLQFSRLDEAGQSFTHSVDVDASYVLGRAYLALVHWEKKELDAGQSHADLAVKQDPTCAHAWKACGLIAYSKLEPVLAIDNLEKALALNPELAVARDYLASAFIRLGRPADAMRHYDIGLKLHPRHPQMRFGWSLSHLGLGMYEEGWLDYEWRFHIGQVSRPEIARPRWDGSSLEGKRLLVHTEQGMGDVLQFVRLLPILKQRGARIVFACQKALQKLLSRCAGIDEWMPIDEPAPMNFDLVTPLLSVPGLIGLDEQNLPREVPYVFAEPERVEKWRPIIKALPGFKVGIGWQGSPTFLGDALRSVPLQHFAPLAEVPGVNLICLQKGPGLDQLDRLDPKFPITHLDDFNEAGGAFMDSAAIMQHLDLVVTSDSALAHLAGALGVPVWMAVPIGADWRWLLERDDSPWYPSMRIFRQPGLKDWDAVFASIAGALKERAQRPPTSWKPTARLLSTPQVDVAPGELIDKITILEIKSERMEDATKLANVRLELATLQAARGRALLASAELDELVAQLKKVNEELWEIEDKIRDCERQKDFGSTFVELARSVYRSNDHRADLKRQINELLGSSIREEKNYAPYD